MADVVDKIIHNLDYGATVVTEKTRATYDEARVRISMEGLRGEREDALIAIGERVMQLHASGEALDDVLTEICARIHELDQSIAYMRGKIDGIRQNADDNIKRKKESDRA